MGAVLGSIDGDWLLAVPGVLFLLGLYTLRGDPFQLGLLGVLDRL